MSPPLGKIRIPKAKKLKLVAKNQRKIKAALDSWCKASDQVDSDPMGLDDAPPWVLMAWVEVVKAVMPSNRLPISGEWDLELVGEFWGRLQAFGRLYSGVIPMGPTVQAESECWQKFEASQPQSVELTARKKNLGS